MSPDATRGFPPPRYVMDTEQARSAKIYTSRFSGGAKSKNVRYDSNTHGASRAGFVMIRGGIGFIHTNGAVCRFCSEATAGEGVVSPHFIRCPCGMLHVS